MRKFTAGFALGLLLASGAALASYHNPGAEDDGYTNYWRGKNRQQSEENWRRGFTERNSRSNQPC